MLYLWDSSQIDDLDAFTGIIPERFQDHFINLDISTESDSHVEESRFEEKNRFDRGVSYCSMLYIKMNVDLFVSDAAKKYKLMLPRVIGIGDDDTYWSTLPVR